MQAGNIAIPGSSNPAHIEENIEIFDFELTEEEMQKIALMDEGHGKYPEFDEATGQRFLSFSPDFNAQE
jgi:diketogulonate reductase-like aldo/keto reductase